MKNYTLRIFIFFLLSLDFGSSLASAQTRLTGGDSSDGLNLSGTLVGAIYDGDYYSTGAPVTLQSYAFQPLASNSGETIANGNISVDGAVFSLGDPQYFSPETATNAGFTRARRFFQRLNPC
ncbi:MAG: hypothetical protein WDO13_21590 [Verrucomicrobiota bacterium]